MAFDPSAWTPISPCTSPSTSHPSALGGSASGGCAANGEIVAMVAQTFFLGQLSPQECIPRAASPPVRSTTSVVSSEDDVGAVARSDTPIPTRAMKSRGLASLGQASSRGPPTNASVVSFAFGLMTEIRAVPVAQSPIGSWSSAWAQEAQNGLGHPRRAQPGSLARERPSRWLKSCQFLPR